MNKDLNLTLNLEQVNIILAALGKMPFETVFALISDLRNQIGPQLNPAPKDDINS
jgi:hypothetical protein